MFQILDQTKWGSWGSYGSCSKTCGPGLKTRSRKCNNQISDGGSYCVGSAASTEPCNTQKCQGTKILCLIFYFIYKFKLTNAK